MPQIAFRVRRIGEGLKFLFEGAFGCHAKGRETADVVVALRAARNRNRKEEQDRKQTRGRTPSQKTIHERPMVTSAILPQERCERVARMEKIQAADLKWLIGLATLKWISGRLLDASGCGAYV
jgi:hypothetical protein